MIARWQKESVLSALKARRVVHLTGARQTGKTTLAKSLGLERSRHVTLDKALYLKAAQDDASGFLGRSSGETLIIDEVQKVPALLDEIKIRVDENGERGQYLLTGSANLRFAKAIKDSLAGRMRTVRLRTLTSGEIALGTGDFLSRAFAREFKSVDKGFGKRDIVHACFAGGYPEAMELGDRDRRDWFRDYMGDILMKDVRDVTEIRKLPSLRMVAKWLLAHTARLFVQSELCSKAQISKDTADGYISALTALYLFDEVEPWSGSDYGRLGKRSKYFAADPALPANLLGWNEDEAYYDDDRCGKIVETWVYRELSALADFEGGYAISHYRDSDKREIDFIVENEAGDLLGVEVKSGSSVGDSDFTNMRWFRNNLAKTVFTGIVLYSGSETARFGEGMYAVPFGMLAL
jgi:hypothetical protein